MNEDVIVNGIAGVIQRVYGDATQTVLDRRAAREIWGYLTEHGVVTAGFLAAVVAAAGGVVTVPDAMLEDPGQALFSTRDFDGVTLRVAEGVEDRPRRAVDVVAAATGIGETTVEDYERLLARVPPGGARRSNRPKLGDARDVELPSFELQRALALRHADARLSPEHVDARLEQLLDAAPSQDPTHLEGDRS